MLMLDDNFAGGKIGRVFERAFGESNFNLIFYPELLWP